MEKIASNSLIEHDELRNSTINAISDLKNLVDAIKNEIKVLATNAKLEINEFAKEFSLILNFVNIVNYCRLNI